MEHESGESEVPCGHRNNATVLAYGQAGPGKTFTMGGAHYMPFSEEELGNLQRAIR